MKDFMPPQRRDGDMTVIMLINEVSRLFGSAIRDMDAQDSDMSQESFRFILISLSHTDGVTQLELCRSTHLKAPTISVTLGKMEEMGYVRREKCQNDQRSIKVYLTEKGRRLHDDKLARIKQLDAMVTQDITPEETAQVMSMLFRIREKLFEVNGIKPSGCKGEKQ